MARRLCVVVVRSQVARFLLMVPFVLAMGGVRALAQEPASIMGRSPTKAAESCPG